MARFERNPHYTGNAVPGTADYWLGSVLLSSRSGLSFLGLEDRLFGQLQREVPDTVKFYEVATESLAAPQRFRLRLEYDSHYPSDAATLLSELMVNAVMHAGLDLTDSQLEADCLVNGAQLQRDRTLRGIETTRDYATVDPLLVETLHAVYESRCSPAAQRISDTLTFLTPVITAA